jgi:hypothetical protein
MSDKANTAEPGMPRRRWYQFRLRTLLVVVTLLAIPCGYVGWQARIVHERKAVIAEVERLGGSYSSRRPSMFEAGDPCWIRLMLGDVPTHGCFVVPLKTDPAVIRRIKLAFPDGVVMAFVLRNGEWDAAVFDENGDKH